MRRCVAIPLIALAGVALAEPATHLQSVTWTMDHPRFGGWSAIDFTTDGESFVAVSDRGALIEGRLIREAGRIIGIEASAPSRIRDPQGRIPKRNHTDTEGLAIARDGARVISLEGLHLLRSLKPDGTTSALPANPAFKAFAPNASLEALAVDAKGRLYTLPERSGQITEGFPLFRLDGQVWTQIATLARRGGFLPVGADIGPDGRLYLLERGFNGLGFRSRIRRFDLSETGIANETTLLATKTAAHDNLEGLAIWQAPDGLRATMISDDNFQRFQRTEIVEYALPNVLN